MPPPRTLPVTLERGLLVRGKAGSLTYGGGNTIFVIQGTLATDVMGGRIDIRAAWTNNGTVQVKNGGAITAIAPTNYTCDGTLSGGTWQVYDNSILRITMSAGLVTNAANVLLDGANSHFYSNAGTGDALAALTTNAGSLTVQNGRAFTSTGDLSDSGTLLVGPGGTVTVTGTCTEAGTLNVRATGLMSVAGALANFDGTNLTGGTYLLAGTFQFPSAAIGNNAANLVLDGYTSQILDQNGNDALAGLSGNSGSLTLVNARSLNLAGDFSDAGTLNINGSCTLTINGTCTEQGSVTIQGGGRLIATGSVANFDGASLNGGSFDLVGTFQFTGAAIQANAANLVLDGSAAQIVDENGNDALAGLALNAAGASLTLQNGRSLTTAGDFENDGTLTVGSRSTLTITGIDTDTGSLSVLSGGTPNLVGGGSSSGSLSNAGTLILAAGSGFTSTGSYGQNGTLMVADTALFSLLGTFSNFDGATLSGGTYDILGTFQFTGAAVVTNAATLVLDGPDAMIVDENGNDGLGMTLAANTGSLTFQNGANFTTAADFRNSGTLTIGAGSSFTVRGALMQMGTLTIQAMAAVSLLGGGSSNAGISNAGTLTIGGTSAFSVAASWSLAGTVVVQAGARLNLADGSSNSGTLTNAGTVMVAGNFSNRGSVMLAVGSGFTASGNYVQTGGLTTLSGGALTAMLVDLQGGSVAGAGTITANVRNAATIDVGGVGAAGLLRIVGNYTQTAAGVLNIEVGGPNAGSEFDQLAISGQATLDGTLNVSMLHGYTPAHGQTFAVLTFAGHTGAFAHANVGTVFMTPRYDSGDVTLVAN